MRFPAALLLGGMFVVPAVSAPVRQNVTIGFVAGFVTRATSPGDFDVNGIRIRCGNETNSSVVKAGKALGAPGCPQTTPYVGQGATVKGKFRKKDQSLNAREIELSPRSITLSQVSGSAVIDAPPHLASVPPESSSLRVRADGYRILIPGKALIVWEAPLHSFADVKAGDWIHYEGRQRADGMVVADKVSIGQLVVSRGEEKFRTKRDFDPSKVPASAKQSAASMTFLGVNLKRFPPYDDPLMQARVNDIGDKLVPAYERDLPDSAAAKIHFRFQVISTKKFRDALASSSGVILVPQQVVARMQNDAQLATVLADNIAAVLERQDYRDLPAARTLGAGMLAADAAGFFVPGVGLMAPALDYGGSGAMRVKAEEQSGRVALGLLHDAGYNIDQAPVAWWLLASKTPKPISEIPLPRRAAYLYKILGECWNSPQAAADRH
jgi:hypothetical protein